ncbi:MAG: hypothetical protein KGO50_15275, partial [Myxococcales bacterium]|nr:hypothetical protein [Myxococcales bacterium]
MTIFWVGMKKVVPWLALMAVVGVLMFAMYLAMVGWHSAGELAEETQQQLDASASEVSRLVQEQAAVTQRVEQARQAVNTLDTQLNRLSEEVQQQRVTADTLSGAR